MIQSNTTVEDEDQADKYVVGAMLRFEGPCPDETAHAELVVGDLLTVSEDNGGGFGICCVRVRDGHPDQVWPCEVSLYNPAQLTLFGPMPTFDPHPIPCLEAPMQAPQTVEIIVPDPGTKMSVHDEKCVGCQRHKRDIMLSFGDDKGTIADVFFTREQAQQLSMMLAAVLAR